MLFVSFLTEASLLSVSDTEILLWTWRSPSTLLPEHGEMNADDPPTYSVVPIASANSQSCCYQTAAIDDCKKLVAVATSNDNVLLFDIEQQLQLAEFIGHTG